MDVDKNPVHQNMSLTIHSHAIENAAVLGVFRVVAGLCWGPSCPWACDSGSLVMCEIDLPGGMSIDMN